MSTYSTPDSYAIVKFQTWSVRYKSPKTVRLEHNQKWNERHQKIHNIAKVENITKFGHL